MKRVAAMSMLACTLGGSAAFALPDLCYSLFSSPVTQDLERVRGAADPDLLAVFQGFKRQRSLAEQTRMENNAVVYFKKFDSQSGTRTDELSTLRSELSIYDTKGPSKADILADFSMQEQITTPYPEAPLTKVVSRIASALEVLSAIVVPWNGSGDLEYTPYFVPETLALMIKDPGANHSYKTIYVSKEEMKSVLYHSSKMIIPSRSLVINYSDIIASRRFGKNTESRRPPQRSEYMLWEDPIVTMEEERQGRFLTGLAPGLVEIG